MADALDEVLRRRSATDLVALRAVGDLQQRYDTKYVLSAAPALELLDALDRDWQVLEVDGKRSTDYQSSYYDDSEFGLFHDHVQGRRLRYKVRTRRYGNDPEEMLEVKLKSGRGATDKRRLPRTSAPKSELTVTELRWLADTIRTAYGRPPADVLRYTLGLDYTRRTMFNPVSGERLTIDTDIVAVAESGTIRPVGDAVIIEVKSAKWSCPTVRLLHRHSIRPVTFSKYLAALAALHPHLDQRARLRAHRSFDRYS